MKNVRNIINEHFYLRKDTINNVKRQDQEKILAVQITNKRLEHSTYRERERNNYRSVLKRRDATEKKSSVNVNRQFRDTKPKLPIAYEKLFNLSTGKCKM